jgi:hypothetical protein
MASCASCAFAILKRTGGVEHSWRQILLNLGQDSLLCCFTQTHRVRTHIADETGFIQFLCRRHRAFDAEPKFSAGFLLER